MTVVELDLGMAVKEVLFQVNGNLLLIHAVYKLDFGFRGADCFCSLGAITLKRVSEALTRPFAKDIEESLAIWSFTVEGSGDREQLLANGEEILALHIRDFFACRHGERFSNDLEDPLPVDIFDSSISEAEHSIREN